MAAVSRQLLIFQGFAAFHILNREQHQGGRARIGSGTRAAAAGRPNPSTLAPPEGYPPHPQKAVWGELTPDGGGSYIHRAGNRERGEGRSGTAGRAEKGPPGAENHTEDFLHSTEDFLHSWEKIFYIDTEDFLHRYRRFFT